MRQIVPSHQSSLSVLQEIELETNLSRSIVGALWRHKYIFERRFRFREILHPTRATFETSTVVEPFVDLWIPSALAFMIAWYTLVRPLTV